MAICTDTYALEGTAIASDTSGAVCYYVDSATSCATVSGTFYHPSDTIRITTGGSINDSEWYSWVAAQPSRVVGEIEEEEDEAEKKAKDLLLDIIGEKELKVFEETGRILAKGKRHNYIIHESGVVERIEEDRIARLCIHLLNQCAFPNVDNVIALKLLAEADDYKFDELANHLGSMPRPTELPLAACM